MTEGRPCLFWAKYAGVMVIEFHRGSDVVMRRYSDDYVNATQILKFAQYEKVKRTRILERQIHPGQHQKIQGGFGGYQGTWIPLSRAAEFARELHLWNDLQALLTFDRALFATLPAVPSKARSKSSIARANRLAVTPRRTAKSPAHTATGGKRKRKQVAEETPLAKLAPRSPELLAKRSCAFPTPNSVSSASTPAPLVTSLQPIQPSWAQATPQSESKPAYPWLDTPTITGASIPEAFSGDSTESEPNSETTSEPAPPPQFNPLEAKATAPSSLLATTARHTPSGAESFQEASDPLDLPGPPSTHAPPNEAAGAGRRGSGLANNAPVPAKSSSYGVKGRYPNLNYRARSMRTLNISPHASQMLHYIHHQPEIPLPSPLTDTCSDFHPNDAIDDQGNTLLHWAAIMRRFTLIDTLLRQGADPNSTNSYHESPLYSAIMYAFTQHIYALSTVETLLTHLGATLGLPNARGWTVLHFLANAAQTVAHEQAALVYLQGCLNQLATASPKASVSPSIVWIRDDRQRTALDLTHPAADNPVRQLLQRFMHCYPTPPLRSFSHHSLPGGTPWGVPVDVQGHHRTTDSSSPLPSPATSRRTSLCSNHSAVQFQRHPSPPRSMSFSEAACESRAMLPSPIHLSLPDPHQLPSTRRPGPVTPAPSTALNSLDHHRRHSLHLTEPATPVPSRVDSFHSATPLSTAAFHINGDPQLSLPPLRTPRSGPLTTQANQTTNGRDHQPHDTPQPTRPTALTRVISSPPCMASLSRTPWKGSGAINSHHAYTSVRSNAQIGPPLGTFSPPRYPLGNSSGTKGPKPPTKVRKAGGPRHYTMQSNPKLAMGEKPLSARPLATPASTNPSSDRYDQTVSTIMNHVTDVIHAKRKDHLAVQGRLQDEINTLTKTLQAVTEERQSLDQQAAHLNDQNQHSLRINPSVQAQLPDSWASAFATASQAKPPTLPLAKGEPYIVDLRQALQLFLAKQLRAESYQLLSNLPCSQYSQEERKRDRLANRTTAALSKSPRRSPARGSIRSSPRLRTRCQSLSPIIGKRSLMPDTPTTSSPMVPVANARNPDLSPSARSTMIGTAEEGVGASQLSQRYMQLLQQARALSDAQPVLLAQLAAAIGPNMQVNPDFWVVDSAQPISCTVHTAPVDAEKTATPCLRLANLPTDAHISGRPTTPPPPSLAHPPSTRSPPVSSSVSRDSRCCLPTIRTTTQYRLSMYRQILSRGIGVPFAEMENVLDDLVRVLERS
ncbi:Transcription factor mbp1 [Dimargaris xerosporica]|nr:Transcription factor mbp1 [Dimargaris xerosporica]